MNEELTDRALCGANRPIDAFSESAYHRHLDLFWALPSCWGDPEHGYTLGNLRRAGGTGVFCLLPVLGMIAGLKTRGDHGFSIERIAELTGADRRTIKRASIAVAQAEIASTRIGEWMGKLFTHWNVASSLSALMQRAEAVASGESSPSEYFYFSLRLIYGGSWALLPHTLKGLYLGAAVCARTFTEPSSECWLLDYLKDGVGRADFEAARAFAIQEHPEAQGIRLACVSYARLSRITGITTRSLATASALLKHPDDWPSATTSPEVLDYLPLRVYPTLGGNALIYHFRDHAPRIPSTITAHRNWNHFDELTRLLAAHASA
jgi:hypothetical protein